MSINVSQSFHRTSANAVDDTLTLTKAQMLAVNDNLMPSKYLTICQEDGQIYLYDKSATPSVETGKFTKFEGGGGGTSDYTDLTNKPKINNVELSGNKSSSDLGISLSSLSGDSTHRTVTDTEKSTWNGKQSALTVGDGIDITDGEISTDNMPASDMSEIVTPLPSVMSRRMKYSTDEQVIGEWIDGKPIYQKTFFFDGSLKDSTTAEQSWLQSIGANVDTVVNIFGKIHSADAWATNLPLVTSSGGQYAIPGIYTDATSSSANKNKVGIFWKGTLAWAKNPVITLQYTKTID